MKLIFSLILALNVFAQVAFTKEKSRELASKAKKTPPLTCSDAKGDGGYSLMIYNSSRVSILENRIYGAMQIANLDCVRLPAKQAAPDMMFDWLSCKGKGLHPHPDLKAAADANDYSTKDIEVTLSTGGFAGLTMADLDIAGTRVADNIVCHN